MKRGLLSRSLPLRRRLFSLAAAAIAPLVLVSTISFIVLVQQQQAQAERAGIEITRALSTAVGYELRRSISVLQTLATSGELDGGDLDSFALHARWMLAIHPAWDGLLLVDSAARVVYDTRSPAGGSTLPAGMAESLRTVIRNGAPFVGDLVADEDGDFNVFVGVPVLREMKIRYVLAASLRPEAIREVVSQQRLPEDWVVSIFDSRGIRVARSRRHDDFIGTRPSPTLITLMGAGGESGSGVTYTLEGERIYTAYSYLEPGGWSVAIGIPPSVVEAGARRSLVVFGAGVLLSISIGMGLALRAARNVEQPMEELREAAHALGQRRPVAAPVTVIEEIRHVGEALVSAAAERATFEREREELLGREREARALAEAANRAKDQFLAMLGHELRNPLGAIANASHLLGHPNVDEATAARAVQVVRRQVDHLRRLLDDLLDAGRAVLDKIVLDREAVDFAAVTERALASLETAGRFERHRLTRDLSSVWVDADATRLEQIVANLITNAVRYTPEGKSIHVRVSREGGEAVLRVSDEGIGMSAELAGRVFDLFAQGDRELDRAHGGLGIGLTLVRRLAELHGGSAVGESPGPGRGSEFTVRLPAIEPPRVTVVAEGSDRTPACDVLIIEDNEDAREMLRRLLEVSGHRVRVESDGEAGLAAAVAHRPDVVLLDVGLPALNGYEVARRIREHDGDGAPFLVALTGYGLAEDRARASEAGFDAHLVKPADEAELRAVFARVASARAVPLR